jgi:KaiC/GvpD/RAD55 family RecA-like ATPase
MLADIPDPVPPISSQKQALSARGVKGLYSHGVAEMSDLNTGKMPTGIESLDPVMDGGIPPGSVVLLLAETGSGSSEFIYSSILSVSKKITRPGADENLSLQLRIRYITFTKMSEDIRRELALSFHPDLLSGLNSIQFEDLSQIYFDKSVVPIDWYIKGDIISRLQNRGSSDVLERLSMTLESGEKNSLIVLDSLTDLATEFSATPRWKDLMAFLRGLQRISKQWNSTIYLPLTKGILDLSQEYEIMDISDAVILFRWEESSSARRQRVMFFEKFRGLMPHLEERDLVKFSVRISSATGFEVSNIRVVI